MLPAIKQLHLAAACTLLLALGDSTMAVELNFEVVEVEPRSRIDAIAYLGNGVVLAGTRGSQPGHLHKSDDYGATWHHVGNITGNDFITCLSADADGVAYLLTGQDVHVWKTTDYGETWRDLGQISQGNNPHYANAYGMLVTGTGTLLVADADSTGGHIHRSSDQGATWKDLGAISTRALYRLNQVGDGIIVNGWAGHIYRSTDDGATWNDMGKLIDSDLYAIEYLGDGAALIGTKSGNLFSSKDNGETWQDQGIVGDAADDFAWLGGRRALYSTYTGDRNLFFTNDTGTTWRNIGPVPTGHAKDWLDHFIPIHDGDVHVVVGGTNQGYILRSKVPSE